MRTNPPKRSRLVALAVLCGLVALGWVGGPGASPAAAADELVGTFRITAGSCGSGATGSYFRMILPTGTLDGPWVENKDSACGDKTYTLFTPGTDGGLVTGSHQPAPNPGFDGNGNSLANRIIRPVAFFGVKFATSTNPTDLQTGSAVPAPSLRADGGRLTGDLSSFAATWNKQAFNQGAPKPGGATPGLTTAPTGTFDAATGAFSVTWTSTIVGGPFDKFTGQWHLEGTFVPAGSGSTGSSGTGGTTATTAAPAGGAPDATVPAGDEVAAPTDEPPAAGEVAVPTGEDATAERASSVRVEDQGFEAPVWLVVLLAAVGIAGVVALLVLGPRSPEGSSA